MTATQQQESSEARNLDQLLEDVHLTVANDKAGLCLSLNGTAQLSHDRQDLETFLRKRIRNDSEGHRLSTAKSMTT